MTESTRALGRLAQVIATRGGLAPPEEPFVIEHREALIYMLCEAAPSGDYLGEPSPLLAFAHVSASPWQMDITGPILREMRSSGQSYR